MNIMKREMLAMIRWRNGNLYFTKRFTVIHLQSESLASRAVSYFTSRLTFISHPIQVQNADQGDATAPMLENSFDTSACAKHSNAIKSDFDAPRSVE
jgi:hypothetical protein